MSCKHCEILGEVFLPGKVRNERLFGAGLKFVKASDSTLRKCELLQKKLLYYPLRKCKYFCFKYSIFCYRVWDSES